MVLVQLWLIIVVFVLGHAVERHHVSWISESGIALLVGVVLGIVVHNFGGAEVQAQYRFSTDLFFVMLLPPIIFEAGFSLDVKPFFYNIGGICVYAFLGTTLSAFIIAAIMWLVGSLHLVHSLTVLESLLFGAIVSATDPVTVLSVFSKLSCNSNLHALIFGESVMNDAVAIVMYKTLLRYLTNPFTLVSILAGIAFFFGAFLGSMVIGMLYAVLASSLFRTGWFRSDLVPLEASLTLLLGFSSYYSAESAGLSGIVAILFCGIGMARYARTNLTRRGEARTRAFLKISASVSESFVFIYIGASPFLERQAWADGLTWTFLLVALLALGVSRAAHIVPLTKLINLFRPAEHRIPPNHEIMMWWSGLRGAIAFALALETAEDLLGEDGRPSGSSYVLRTTTFFIVLITVLVNGGGCTYVLQRLRLQTDDEGVSQDGGIADMEETGLLRTTPQDSAAPVPDEPATPLMSSGRSPAGRKDSSLLEAARDFNRRGGIATPFSHFDQRIAKLLTRERQTEEHPAAGCDPLSIEMQSPRMRALRTVVDSEGGSTSTPTTPLADTLPSGEAATEGASSLPPPPRGSDNSGRSDSTL